MVTFASKCLIFLTICLVKSVAFELDGVVVPADPFKFVNDSLTLYCNITNPNLRENSSLLYFVKTKPNEETRISNRYIRILTTKSIRLHIPRLKLSDDGNYNCHQDTFQSRNAHDRFIGHQVVRVDYRPKKVDKINCRVYNWMNMTCSWDLGVKYKHPENINVTFGWTISGNQMSCPKLTNSSCEWPRDKYFHNHIYLMSVVVRSIEGGVMVRSPTFKIETRLYETFSSVHHNENDIKTYIADLEPAPIQDFQASEENSTCILLSWNHSSQKRYEKYYVAQYRAQTSSEWTDIILDDWLSQQMRALVCNLTPFSDYKFQIAVLPYPEHSEQMSIHGFRSKWISVSAKTRADVPGSSPPVCPGCYYIHKCPDVNNNTGCRMIRVYWQEVPQHDRHGIIQKYTVHVHKEGETSVKKYDIANVTNESFPFSEARYEVQLKAGTSKGFSNSPSVLMIPSSAKRPDPPKQFLVETDVHHSPFHIRHYRERIPLKYYLSWASLVSSPFNYSGISVVWCKGNIGKNYVCEDNINWINLSRDNVTYELMPGRNLHGSIIIGVSAQVMDGNTVISSGIEWSSCVYERNTKPQTKPKVKWSETHPNGGLTLLWDKLDCPKELAYVTEYRVSICRTLDEEMCQETMKNQTIKGKTEATFTDLKNGKKYLAKVWAVSSAGYGPSSSPIVDTVQLLVPKDVDDSVLVAIIIVVVVLVVILGLVIYCGYKYVAYRKERVYEDIPPTKRSPNRPVHFQNRPLPAPPNAEQHYYGLNACMTTLGSDCSHSMESSSDNSVNSHQGQPLLFKDQQSESDSQRNKYYQLSKEDDDSMSQISNSGMVSKSPANCAHDTSMSNKTGSSSGQQYPEVSNYRRITMASSSNGNGSDQSSMPSSSGEYAPHSALLSGDSKQNIAYEIPQVPPGKSEVDKQMLFHRQGTLQLRPIPAKVLTDIGQNHKMCQGNHNCQNLQNDSLNAPCPQLPVSLPPERPARHTLHDAPPSFPAPPPPKRKRKTQSQRAKPSLNNDHIPFNDCDRFEMTPREDSPQGFSHFQHDPNSPFSVNTRDPCLSKENFTNTRPSLTNNVPLFHVPPPPPYPPSPDPSSQITKMDDRNMEPISHELPGNDSLSPVIVSDKSNSWDPSQPPIYQISSDTGLFKNTFDEMAPSNSFDASSDTPSILFQSFDPLGLENEPIPTDSATIVTHPASYNSQFSSLQEGSPPEIHDNDANYTHCVAATFKEPFQNPVNSYDDDYKPHNSMTFQSPNSLHSPTVPSNKTST